MHLYHSGELTSNSENYNDIFNAYLAFYESKTQDTFSTLDNEMHNAMNDFIETMGNSVLNYANSKGYNVSAQWCIELAWGSMYGTDLFEEVLTDNQQINYGNIYAIETTSPTGQQTNGTVCP